MNIDIASLYLILAAFYFLLPVSVYFATAEFRDRQVYWWCLGGLGTSIGFLLIGLRGHVPDLMSYYVAHIALVVGFSFRSLSLRLELSTNMSRTVWKYVGFGLAYYILFAYSVFFNINEFLRLNLVHLYLVLMSADLLRISQAIYSKLKNRGGKLIAWMAILILVGLVVRMVGYITEWGGTSVFEKAGDQYIGIFVIIIGYVLGNFGFIQLRMEKLWEKKKAVDVQLADTRSKNKTLEEILEEKNSLMRTLSLSAKANSMGTMLGAIAHEINQPLGAIRLNTEMLLALTRRQNDKDGFQQTLEYILQDNERAAVVVSSLRKFFVKGSSEFKPLDLSQLVRDAHQIIFLEARLHSVNLHAEIESDSLVSGDENQLQMVVLNLINNAIEAVKDLAAEKNVYIKLFKLHDKVVLEVSDNGVGVPEERVASIFELFHTSKVTGMGMGLWLSRAIMDSHEGSIELLKGASNETLFRVSLPALSLSKVNTNDTLSSNGTATAGTD